MDAIILAGGFGTRLQPVVSDVPKPMAPINGKPFLEILLKSLEKKGIRRVILSVGYKAELIMNYFGSSYCEIELVYEVEDTPLGTGGAIKAALTKCNTEKVLVLNGDTYLEFDLMPIHNLWTHYLDPIILGIKILDADRYGSITHNADMQVIAFNSKSQTIGGCINSGHYILPKNIFDNLEMPNLFSFEIDFLPKSILTRRWSLFEVSGKFIDIGIPKDFERAQNLLDNL